MNLHGNQIPSMSSMNTLLCLLLCIQSSACSLVLEEVPQPEGLIDEREQDMAGIAGIEAGQMAGELAGQDAGDIAGEEGGTFVVPEVVAEALVCESFENCDLEEPEEPSVVCDGLSNEPELTQVVTCSGASCALPTYITDEDGERTSNNETNEQKDLRDNILWALYLEGTNEELLPDGILTSPDLEALSTYNLLPTFDEMESTELEISGYDCEEVNIVSGDLIAVQNTVNDASNYSGFIERTGDNETLSFDDVRRVTIGTCRASAELTLNNLTLTNAAGSDSPGLDELSLASATEVLIDDLTINTSLQILEHDSERLGSGSLVTIRKLNTSRLQNLLIDSSRVTFDLDNDNPQELNMVPNQNRDIYIKDSVITSNGTLNIKKAMEDNTDGLINVVIENSTLIMSETNKALFDMDQVSLVINSSLIISAGPTFILRNSKAQITDSYILSPSTSNCGGSVFTLNSSQAFVYGQWLQACQNKVYKVDKDSGLILETAIAKNVKTLVEKELSDSTNNPDQTNELSFINFTGETLIRSNTSGFAQDFTGSWQLWSMRYSQPDFITFADDDQEIHLNIHHIYARSGSNDKNLIDITGGGAYKIEKSHLNGSSLFSQLVETSPVVFLQDSLFEGKININAAYAEVVSSLFKDLTVELSNSSYFLANQLMRHNHNTAELTVNARNSSIALNQIRGSTSFNLIGSMLIGRSLELSLPMEATSLLALTSSELYLHKSEVESNDGNESHSQWFVIDDKSKAKFTKSIFKSLDTDLQLSTDPLFSLGINNGTLNLEDSIFQDQRAQGLTLYLGAGSYTDFQESKLTFNRGYGVYADQVNGLTFNDFYIQQVEANSNSTEEDLSSLNKSSVALYLGNTGEDVVTLIDEMSTGLKTNAAIVLQNENISLPDDAVSCRGSLWLGDCPAFTSADQGIDYCLGNESIPDNN